MYPRWDYAPSGKLRLDVYDPHAPRYGQQHEGRWIERGSGRIDNKLKDIMAANSAPAEVVKLAVAAKELGASVHMPRIGTGLAGGKWELIEPLILEKLIAAGVKVYVYDFG